MDNLGKAYGQHPANSGPFRLQHIGSWCPGWLSLPERERKNLFLFSFYRNPSEDTTQRLTGGHILSMSFSRKIFLDFFPGSWYHYRGHILSMKFLGNEVKGYATS